MPQRVQHPGGVKAQRLLSDFGFRFLRHWFSPFANRESSKKRHIPRPHNIVLCVCKRHLPHYTIMLTIEQRPTPSPGLHPNIRNVSYSKITLEGCRTIAEVLVFAYSNVHSALRDLSTTLRSRWHPTTIRSTNAKPNHGPCRTTSRSRFVFSLVVKPSAILRIALGKHTGATAAHEATYHEPFTYWDWHAVPPNDTYAREWKRQRVWEYNTSFTVHHRVLGYPTPRERWEAFKSNVSVDLRRVQWVKRIAVANWMDLDDMRWYVHAWRP
jgi:hypothetical protein